MKNQETPPRGEAALLEQIDTLQKQLDDCLDNGKFLKHDRLSERVYNIIASVLTPIEGQNQWELWFNFRAQIFDTEGCSHLFENQAFRAVVNELNRMIDDFTRRDKHSDVLFFSMADVLVYYTTAEGWSLALEALSIIEQRTLPKGDEHIFTPFDIQELRLCMQTIHRCVKAWHEAEI